jgi:hypothetical protein
MDLPAAGKSCARALPDKPASKAAAVARKVRFMGLFSEEGMCEPAS